MIFSRGTLLSFHPRNLPHDYSHCRGHATPYTLISLISLTCVGRRMKKKWWRFLHDGMRSVAVNPVCVVL
jgi:hypothetical protein